MKTSVSEPQMVPAGKNSLAADTAASMARGACPTLGAPMQTGDGLLARIALDEAIRPSDLLAIAQLALHHGNGLIDISARGNLQVRGLTTQSARRLELDVRDLGLPLRVGIPVETGALSGHDPAEIADPRLLAAAIRSLAARAGWSSRLAPKFSVIVDGGGHLPLDMSLADIRLMAVPEHDGEAETAWRLLLGGSAATGRPAGMLSGNEAAECVADILSRMAMMPGSLRLRGRDLDMDAVRSWLGHRLRADRPSAMRTRPNTNAPVFGKINLASHGWAARIGLSFGQCRAEPLIAVCQTASRLGIMALRPATDHSLVFFGEEAGCQAMLEAASNAGFIVSTGDPRATIAACPGQPACATAHLATHDLGRSMTEHDADLLDGSFTLHLSGCAKGCARTAPALLTIVGADDRTALIFEGKTSDMPLTSITRGQEVSGLAHLATLVRSERRTDETSGDCLRRLGPARVAQTFSQGQP